MGLSIDRKQVKNTFQAYVDRYDHSDGKIFLKISHTYRVAADCEQIARGLNLSEGDVELAWLIGMLHDLGRFEQLRRYGTFSDADSIDHAHFAVELLFEEGLVRDYVQLPDGDLQIVKCAIWNHSAYRIEPGLDERTLLFCKIIRDADKIDIFKVISETPIETLHGYSQKALEESVVSPQVMKDFREGHAVLRKNKKTPADYLAAHIALAFELEFAVSRQLAQEQGYLQKLLSFQPANPVAEEQFREIRERMGHFLIK